MQSLGRSSKAGGGDFEEVWQFYIGLSLAGGGGNQMGLFGQGAAEIKIDRPFLEGGVG